MHDCSGVGATGGAVVRAVGVEEVGYKGCGDCVDVADGGDDLGGGDGLAGEVQADHGDGPVGVEDDRSSFGVGVDVEFGDGGDVAGSVTSTHKDDFVYAVDDAGLDGYRGGDVGHRANGDQGDGAGVVGHDGVDDQLCAVAGIGGAVRGGQWDAADSVGAVDVGGVFVRVVEGPCASGCDGCGDVAEGC